MTVAIKKTKHPFVSIEPGIAGGQPVISGTRIKVLDIATRYELRGISPDGIVDEYPHLKLEHVHDALSYYYEHKDLFDRKYRQERELLSKLRKKYPSRLKARLG